MARTGRPRKVNIKDLIADADEYIRTADPPILARYAHMHGITRGYLYQLAEGNKELSDTIKRISEAKEAILEEKALSGDYNSSMAIFSLKQLGWSDSKDVKATVEVEGDGFIDALKGKAAEDWADESSDV